MAADGKTNKESYTVCGFDFLSENDAQKAEMDLSKIKVLQTRVKASRPNDIKAVYEKAIENKIFKTPIGWGYLYGMRDQLLESGFTEEDLIPIPVNVPMTRHSAMENLSAKQRSSGEKKNPGFGRIFSIVLNVVLAILVIAMFFIAASGENDNIINYKRNITNRFSSWEQELTERERKVREAEKNLGIESSGGYYEDTESN
jgi:effector-binding domain-containing protein